MKMGSPKAIFFDFGDTLVETEPLYLERMRTALENLGVKLTLRQFEEAYVYADLVAAEATLKEPVFDQKRHSELFLQAIADKLGIEEVVDMIVSRLDDEMVKFSPKRILMDGAGAVLDSATRQGRKVGIISNNDGRTKDKCDEVGISSYFDVILDSTLEGVSKPNPDFFKIAMERVGVTDASKVLHVGDMPGSDILGARNLGIEAIWLNIRDIPLPVEAPVLKTMTELQEAIDSF